MCVADGSDMIVVMALGDDGGVRRRLRCITWAAILLRDWLAGWLADYLTHIFASVLRRKHRLSIRRDECREACAEARIKSVRESVRRPGRQADRAVEAQAILVQGTAAQPHAASR